MNSKSYEILRKLSRGRFSANNFTTLKHLAQNTVGHPDNFLLNEMAIIIDIFSQLDSKVDETEELIKECILDLNPPLLTVPCIDIDSAAIILAEFGDFSKLKTLINFYHSQE